MSNVYTGANVGDLRKRFETAVVEVFGSSNKFLDYIENEEYSQSFYDVFYSGSGECYIINRSTGEYINWYKFTRIGRDIHSTVAPDNFVEFLSNFGLCEKVEDDQEPIVENVGDRLIKREMNKTYKVFCIGGDPKKIAFLANELRKKIDDLQDCGWEIDGVDLINNTRAWDSSKQMYVETPEYIIRAKKENK